MTTTLGALWALVTGSASAPADPNHPRLARGEVRDAERRWAERNAAMEAKPFCQCGAPATNRLPNPPQWPVVGRIQPFWWRCDEHKDVPTTASWSSSGDGTWTTRHGCAREECRSHTSMIATGIITYCDCGTHVGERRP